MAEGARWPAAPIERRSELNGLTARRGEIHAYQEKNLAHSYHCGRSAFRFHVLPISNISDGAGADDTSPDGAESCFNKVNGEAQHPRGRVGNPFHFTGGEIMNRKFICLLWAVLLIVGCGSSQSVKINEAARKEAETAENEAVTAYKKAGE